MDNRTVFGAEFQSFINVLPFFVMFIDEEHTILLVNTYAETIMGKTQEEMIGRYCPNLIHNLDEAFPGCPLEDSLAEGRYIEKDMLDPVYNKWVLSAIYPTPFMSKTGKKIYLHVVRDITDRKNAQEQCKKANEELAAKSRSLEETNIALKVLLEHQVREKENTEKGFLDNVKILVMPYLETLGNISCDDSVKTLAGIIKTNLSEITKPFAKHLTNKAISLSAVEVRVAELVKEGKTAKDIANVLNISENTVKEHVSHIRRKLDLKNKKVNLRTYLHTFLEED